jgi:hypothetical protein
VATTAGAYTNGSNWWFYYIFKFSSNSTGAGGIERLRISNAGAATFAGTITQLCNLWWVRTPIS